MVGAVSVGYRFKSYMGHWEKKEQSMDDELPFWQKVKLFLIKYMPVRSVVMLPFVTLLMLIAIIVFCALVYGELFIAN